MDRKTFSFKITNLDFTGRTVEGYANVFGNKDLTGDIVHPGAFAKTLVERGGKIRFLWQHDTSEPLGRILEMNEDNHGLFIKAIISDTARGRDALALLQDGAINSFSIGYDAIKGGTDYSKDPFSGEVVRNLREIKLWEVSLVTIPANELANVTALKEMTEEDGKAVTRSEQDGDHPASHYLVVEDPEKPSTWHLRVRNVAGELDHRLMGAAWAALHGGYRGNQYEGPGKDEAIAKLRRLYEQEDMPVPGEDSAKQMDESEMGKLRRMREMMDQMRSMIESMVGDGKEKAIDETEMGKMRRMMEMMGSMMDMMDSMMGGGEENDGKEAELEGETKAGRVIARRNAERLAQIRKLLEDLEKDAGLLTEEAEQEEGSDKSAERAEIKAGPQETAPTSTADLLTLIELEQAELSLIEV